jgi:pyruvate kinase
MTPTVAERGPLSVPDRDEQFIAAVTRRGADRARGRRRTRIVATIGPASDSPHTLIALADAGMDVARVPFAHGPLEDSLARVDRIRQVVPGVAILADLPGPKIRTSPFPSSGAALDPDEVILLTDAALTPESSTERIGVVVDGALDLRIDDVVRFGDGGVSVRVLSSSGGEVRARVEIAGMLRGRPGVTLPDSVPLETPTPFDLEAAIALAAHPVEFVAVSFVRTAADLEAIRAVLPIGPDRPLLVPKFETTQSIEHLRSILRVADAAMVARGDLGMYCPLEHVPHLQKQIIRESVRFARPVITATQMLESMTTALVPTRAEVNDVANAVLDGTSAVMLSGETAIGANPVAVVETTARIVTYTETYFAYEQWGAALGLQETEGSAISPERVSAAMIGAGWRAALEEDVSAILIFTRTGGAARAMSRFRPPMPVIAATPLRATAAQLSLSWGVEPVLTDEAHSSEEAVELAVTSARSAGLISAGDVVAVLVDNPRVEAPMTDALRLVIA